MHLVLMACRYGMLWHVPEPLLHPCLNLIDWLGQQHTVEVEYSREILRIESLGIYDLDGGNCDLDGGN
jgi:hypothetical protein